MKSGLLLSAFAVAFVLSGCASTAQVPYSRASAGDIKTIGVPTPSIPAGPSVKMAVTPRVKYGMVGPLADGARESNLKNLALRHNLSVPATFTSRLTERLQSHGYTVTHLSTPRSGSSFIEDYPNNPGVDAYLDVVVTNYGFRSAGLDSTNPYRPSLHAKVRLVRGSDEAVLMQDTIIYNPHESLNETGGGAVTIAGNSAYQYPHYSEIIANSGHAVEGLKEAANQSADTIANLLR